VLFIEHATLYQVRGEVPDGDYVTPIGKSVVQRPGRDVTIVTYSKMLELSTKAADELAKEGIEAEIIDLRTLRPLDIEPVLESFKKTNRAVIVEEGWRSFGVDRKYPLGSTSRLSIMWMPRSSASLKKKYLCLTTEHSSKAPFHRWRTLSRLSRRCCNG